MKEKDEERIMDIIKKKVEESTPEELKEAKAFIDTVDIIKQGTKEEVLNEVEGWLFLNFLSINSDRTRWNIFKDKLLTQSIEEAKEDVK